MSNLNEPLLMTDSSHWRDKPREKGKAAYREGKALDANPYTDLTDALSWKEGWIWSQVYFPCPGHRNLADEPDCLEPED